MDALPTDWLSLLTLVFALGLRHGVDADHVPAIDALTRLSAGRPRRARWCGAMFAAGHGGAVLALVLVLAIASHGWQPPQWLAPLGAWFSIALLALLGSATLRAAWRAGPDDAVQLGGLRGPLASRLFARLLRGGRPAAAACIGALFALSFDTVSLAVVFAASGSAAGGPVHALLLGAAFAAGMLLTDGANGLWLAHLLRQSGHAAARAARMTALAVGGASLAVAAFGALRLAWPAARAWSDEFGLVIGLSLALGLGLLALSLLARTRAARRRPTVPAAHRSASSGPAAA